MAITRLRRKLRGKAEDNAIECQGSRKRKRTPEEADPQEEENKELKKKNKELQKKVEELENKVEELENKTEELENKIEEGKQVLREVLTLRWLKCEPMGNTPSTGT